MQLFNKLQSYRQQKREQQQQQQQQQAEKEQQEQGASELVRHNHSTDGSVRILINNRRSDITTNATMGKYPSEIANQAEEEGSDMMPKSRSGRKFDKNQLPEGHPSATAVDAVGAGEEEDNPYKKKGFLSFLSRKKSPKGVDDDDESVELPLEEHVNNNGLRVPSRLDNNTGNVLDDADDDADIEDVDNLLEDPYAELEGRRKNKTEALMNDYEEDEEELNKKRFLMGLVSKSLFLLGAILFLCLAVHDLQRIKSAGPPLEQDIASNDALENINMNGTAVVNLNNEDAMDEAQKEDRSFLSTTSSVTDSHVWGTRKARHLQATNWYTEYWSNLPGDIKEAAILLGYDQNAWDNSQSVYSDRLYWHQLTPGQQEAATLVFGYDEDSWNDYVNRFLDDLYNSPAPTAAPWTDDTTDDGTETDDGAYTFGTDAPTFSPVEEDVNDENGDDPKDTFYKGVSWDDLPEEVQEAAINLGYNEESWNGNDAVLTEALFFDQLTEREQTAAETMGHNQETWDERDGGPAAEGEGDGDEGNQDEGGGDSGNDSGGDGGSKKNVSSLIVSIEGEYPPEPRGTKYQALYICAAMCMMLVGILDGLQQKLAFHAVMVLAGISGIMAGGFTMFDNDYALNICNSLSTHFFLLQAVLLIYSRLLLTYDNVVRKILSVGDGLFAVGALMNVVLSYLRYDDTTVTMARAATAAAVFWCFAGIIYVGIMVSLWVRRNKTWKNDESSDDEMSIAKSCNVVPSGDGGEECEISYQEPPQKQSQIQSIRVVDKTIFVNEPERKR